MANRRAPSRCSKRGFTFLEAVLGMALLGILAGAIFGVLGYAWRVELEARQTLAAAEIANRVLISYLDDSTSPRDLPETIDYEQMRFRWTLDTEKAAIRDAFPDARVGREGTPEFLEALGNMEFVTVVAWLDDGTDLGQAPGRTPTFRIERTIDPFAFRGTDTIERLLKDPERQGVMINRMIGLEGGVSP